MGTVIGIDLGTTNSCVAVVDTGKPVVIPNTGGYKTTPSMFAISQDGKRLVGHLAKRQSITNARNTVYASKRLIGRRFSEPEVARAVELCPYGIAEGPNEDPRIAIADKQFTCQEVAGIILREMKSVAEEYLGEPVSEAVMSYADNARVAGFMINKFRGDPSLFDDGYAMISEHTGWRGFGVCPWFGDAWRLPAEDALDVRSGPDNGEREHSDRQRRPI